MSRNKARGGDSAKVKAGRAGGLKGGPARARALTPAERSLIAHQGFIAQQRALGHKVTETGHVSLRAKRRLQKGAGS
jgi:hypothetical protein